MKWKFWRRPERESVAVLPPRTHDLVHRDYAYLPLTEDGTRGWIGAFRGPYPRVGDYLLLRAGRNGSTRYRVVDVDIPVFQPDPAGQWFATIEFAPREAVA